MQFIPGFGGLPEKSLLMHPLKDVFASLGLIKQMFDSFEPIHCKRLAWVVASNSFF